MHSLRGTDGLGPQAHELPAIEVKETMGAQHTALAVAVNITFCLREARDRGLITDFMLSSLDQNVQQLVDFLGGCERIRKTPMPFVAE